jgi:hypothetical protein
LLTSLAEGADRIGAEEALARNLPLDVVLPMGLDAFRHDFSTDQSRAAFDTLISKADRVLVLDAEATDAQTRDRLYGNGADALLESSDIIIAIWDGRPPAGRGGTAMTIDAACRRGTPVITIPASGNGVAELIWQGLSPDAIASDNPALLPSAPAISALDSMVRELLAAPGWAEIGEQGRHLQRFIEDGGVADAGEAPNAMLDNAFGRADRLASDAARSFRRAVKVMFGAAFLATALAAAGLAGLAGKGFGISALAWLYDLKPAMLVMEAVMLMLVVTIVVGARRTGLHRRWIEQRQIAETLRMAVALRKAGVSGVARPAVAGRWTDWYVRALVRHAALPALALDAAARDRACAELLALARDQQRYHAHKAHEAEQREHMLETIGAYAFLAAAVAVFAGFLVDPDTKAAIIPLVLAAIILPAFGSALVGVRYVLDYAGVCRRALGAAERYDRVIRHLETAPPELARLRSVARELAEVVLADVASWKLSAESRKLDLPG